MSTLLNDIKYAIRQLLKRPGFTAAALLILALAIGANTAIFSVINAVLLQSLPVRNPDELRVIKWGGMNPSLPSFSGIQTITADGKVIADAFPYPTYVTLRDCLNDTAEIFTFRPLNVIAKHADETESCEALLVSGNFFSGYGTEAAMGRSLTIADDQPDAQSVVIVSHRWQERHCDHTDRVLGQTIVLNRHAFTVVGVLPSDFMGPDKSEASDFYVPLCAYTRLTGQSLLDASDRWILPVMTRLPSGTHEEQSLAALSVAFQQILTSSSSRSRIDQPTILLEDGRYGFHREQRKRSAQPLWLMQIVAAITLVIACANLAGLLLVRGAGRHHEMAVRAALGASRSRLIGQMLAEAILLVVVGGTLGVLLLWSGLPLFFARLAHLDINHLHVDARVLAFAFIVSIVTMLLSGFLPALRTASANLSLGLKNTTLGAASRLRFGNTVVTIQMALSVLLLVTAGLFIRTFVNLVTIDPGFDVDNLLVFRLDGRQTDYQEQQLPAFFDRVRVSLARLPNVSDVASSHNSLLSGSLQTSRVSIPGYRSESDEPLRISELFISESFFRTVGIDLKLGRGFTSMDDKNAPGVVIINDCFAQTYFPDIDPVGRVIMNGSFKQTIIGVCHDAKYQAVRNDVTPTMYSALRQIDIPAMWFAVRTSVPPLSLVPAVRRTLAAIDHNVAMTQIDTQANLFAQSIANERHFACLGGPLAILALLLSSVGIYSLMAYNLNRRTREIGIRLALGATPINIAWPILKEVFGLAAIGAAIGIPVSLALSRITKSMIYDIEPYDPLTLAGAMVLLITITVLAAWIPARRAAKIDPMEALRYE